MHHSQTISSIFQTFVHCLVLGEEKQEDNEKKDSEQQNPNTQSPDREQKEESTPQSASELSSTESSREVEEISDQQLMKLLEGAVEKPHSLVKFRRGKAIRELEEHNITPQVDGW